MKFLIIIGIILVFITAFTSAKNFFILLAGIVAESLVFTLAWNGVEVPLLGSLLRYIIPLGTVYLLITSDDD